MNKIMIGIVVGTILLVGGLVFLGGPSTGQGNNESSEMRSSRITLADDEALFDFGTISMANNKVTHAFRVINSSSDSITIKKIYTSCMCTEAILKVNQRTYGPFGMQGMQGSLTRANVTVSPGDSGDLDVVYDPNAHGPAGVGSIDRFVYLEDEDGGRLELEIKAVVTP